MERRWIGGSCPNINCLPSKNEIWSAKVAHLVRHAAEYGTVTGAVATDMASGSPAQARHGRPPDCRAFGKLQDERSRIDLGAGRFVAAKTLEVRLNDGPRACWRATRSSSTSELTRQFRRFLASRLPEPLTNIEALELDELPQHLIVLGGGYVGLEFAHKLTVASVVA